MYLGKEIMTITQTLRTENQKSHIQTIKLSWDLRHSLTAFNFKLSKFVDMVKLSYCS